MLAELRYGSPPDGASRKYYCAFEPRAVFEIRGFDARGTRGNITLTTVPSRAMTFLWSLLLVALTCVEVLAGPNEDILAASKAGDKASVEAALTQGASVNVVDEKGLAPLGLAGLTPLGLAAAYGHRNIAEFLLDRGANVDVKSRDGLEQTPLHLAAEQGNTDVAKLLIERGADVNARDIAGATPLGWAALRGHKNIATFLIARGAIVNARALSGKTPLHLAAAAGNKELVLLLLSHGADPNIKNSDGQTPLQEMQASSLDPATKANVARALRASTPAPTRTPTPVGKPLVEGIPAPAQAPSSVPACTDVAGIVRLIMHANPNVDWQSRRNSAALLRAIEKIQIAMGCRQPPQTTQCSWVGSVWTCTTQ
jgi:ankyrin repeat protein